MYEYRGLQDGLFIALYIGTAMLALVACLYLLLRRVNAFMHKDAPDSSGPRRLGLAMRSSRRLRRWTAVFFAAMAASHVWWYGVGQLWLQDDWCVRTIMVIMLDYVTLVPLAMAVLLSMLQDRRRLLWPWLVAQSPVVVFAVVGIAKRSMFWGFEVPHYWQLVVIVAFVTYYIYVLRQYGRWLLDNFADLEHKEVWQSMVFIFVLLAVYVICTSNAGGLMREYLSQIITIFIIAFLLWRVETLQELEYK